MSSIESRLARDIAAVTGGVVVTESDLRDARDGVDKRVEVQRQRDRRRTVAVVAAAAVAVPVLGIAALQSLGGDDKTAPPANPGPSVSDPDTLFLTGSAPTPELFDGVWRVDNGTLLVKFTEDGRFQADERGRLFSSPAFLGDYSIAGDVVTVTITGGQPGCNGQQFAMRASFPAADFARIVHTQSATADCSPAPQDARWVLEGVLPPNEFLADLSLDERELNADGWKPPKPAILHGVWMAEGSQQVLELDPDGSYFIADVSGDVVDHGDWSLVRSPSQLRLVSAGDSLTCDLGDRLVLSKLEYLHRDPYLMRNTVAQNTCGAPWTAQGWLRLPDANRSD